MQKHRALNLIGLKDHLLEDLFDIVISTCVRKADNLICDLPCDCGTILPDKFVAVGGLISSNQEVGLVKVADFTLNAFHEDVILFSL